MTTSDAAAERFVIASSTGAVAAFITGVVVIMQVLRITNLVLDLGPLAAL